MQTSLQQGRSTALTAPTEWDLIYYRQRSPFGLAFFHGSGHTATTTLQTVETDDMLRDLARRQTVFVGDFALQSWANPAGIARSVDGLDYMAAQLGVVEPVVLVAGSMGFALAAALTLAHPARVKAIAGIIPLTDIADVRLRGAAASVDAAYPPGYNDLTDGPTHSPVHFADELPADLPIHLWTTSDDPIVPPATADAFVAARPQTGRTNLGPMGHTNAAIAAAANGLDSNNDPVLSVREFVNLHR